MLNSNQSISTTDTASTDTATLGRTLEHLIDTASLNRVTMMITSVCGGRASHIRHTTVDEHLALAWESTLPISDLSTLVMYGGSSWQWLIRGHD